MIRKTLCQIAQATCLATLALSVTMAADQGEPPTVARPANDWATVFITRFDESPLKLENKGAGPMYLERPGTPEVTAALVDGRFAKAINFAATPTILVRLPMVDHPVDQLSVECWLNANASDSITPETIYECRGMHRLKLLREGGAKLVWEARINGVWEALSCPIPLQQWHHAALTYDGHMVKLFLNDKVVAEKARAGRIVRLNTYHRAITLGSDCDTAGRFNGSLDEFRLSRVARSSFLDGKSIVAPLPTTKAVIAKAPPKEIRPDRPYHLHSTLRVPFVSNQPQYSMLWRVIDDEVTRILGEAAIRATKLLSDNRDKLDRLAAALEEREMLDDTDLVGIVGPAAPRRPEDQLAAAAAPPPLPGNTQAARD